MKKEGKGISSVRKVVGIVIILILLSSVCVFATRSNMRDVKIELQNGYELTALTSKDTVGEILKENNIVLADDEKVTPDVNENLPEGTNIKITNKTVQEIQVAQVSEEGAQTSIDDLLEGYAPITEKIIAVEEEIPFETVTKTTTDETEGTTSKILQDGENGLKRTTYKVKYQKDQEIERTFLSEEIVKEPVEKIVQVQKKVVEVTPTATATTATATSRSSTASRTSNGSWEYSADQFDLLCAITAQEASSSYQASLAVISCACNRAESTQWRTKGTDPLSQYEAQGQFCYSIDSNWKKRLNGNYPSFVSQAVTDALNGTRNHNYLSFRSATTAAFGEVIGGNVYFNPMN